MKMLRLFCVALLALSFVPVSAMAAEKVNPFFKQSQQPDKVNKQMLQDLKSELEAIKASMGGGSSKSSGSSSIGSSAGTGVPVAVRSSSSKTQTESANYIIVGRMGDGVLLEAKSDDTRALMVKNGAFIDECYVRYPFFECPVDAPAASNSVSNPAPVAPAATPATPVARPSSSSSASGRPARGGK